jgi:GABA permease
MRIPILTETYFFRLALLIAASLALGAASSPLAGVLLFAAGMLAAVAYEMVNPKPRRSSLREAVHATHRHGSRGEQRHVLVVADSVLGGDGLRRALSERDGAALRLDVLAPVLSSRTHYWTSDLDAEIDEARRRLEASLAWLAAQGIDARGEVGDPDPLTAIEDELRDFGADEVIVVTGVRDRSNRAEADVLARLKAELDVPVSHIVVESGHM